MFTILLIFSQSRGRIYHSKERPWRQYAYLLGRAVDENVDEGREDEVGQGPGAAGRPAKDGRVTGGEVEVGRQYPAVLSTAERQRQYQHGQSTEVLTTINEQYGGYHGGRTDSTCRQEMKIINSF